jgi:hypothetical protein
MANSLSLTATSTNAGIFECPVCRQTIDASSTQCRFCSAVIDPAVAAAATEKMARVNQACSDASFLRTMAISFFAFLGIMFIPFVGGAGYYGMLFLTFAIPFMSVRWWIKFHDLRPDDREFNRGKSAVILISALSLIPMIWFFGHLL